MSEGGNVSSSWKWWPVIMSPAHNQLLLQLPILLHSMTLADYIGDKNWIQQVLVGLSSSFPINYTCYHYTAVGKYCTLCVQMLDGANWHEAPWKLGLFTFWLWSWHCSQLALISTAMIQIYILGARLMSFKKNETYFNAIFWIILQLGLQKACWSHQVERGIILFQALPDLKDTIWLAEFFVKREFIGWHRVPG